MKMPGFCIETVNHDAATFLILHQHKCDRFPGLEIAKLSRMKDIGEFDDLDGAMSEARKMNRDAYACHTCCSDKGLLKAT